MSRVFAGCADHLHCATLTKVIMGGVPNVVNHAKFGQNKFRGFGSLMCQNLPFFPILSAMAYTTG